MAPYLLLTCVFLFCLAAAAFYFTRRLHPNLIALAKRLPEARVSFTRWRGGRVEWEVEGIRASLKEGHYVEFEWSAPGWFWVHRHADRGIGDYKLGARIKIHGTRMQPPHVQFNRMFIAQGDPPRWVHRALSEPVRKNLLALQAMAGRPSFLSELLDLPHTVKLEVDQDGCRLGVSKNHVHNPKKLWRFVQLSTGILRELLKTDPERWIPVRVEAIGDSGTCPVCSDLADAELTTCSGCSTRYHTECWDYLGGCAILGCSEQFHPREPVSTPDAPVELAPPPKAGWLKAPPSPPA